MVYRMGETIRCEAWRVGGDGPEPAWVAGVALRLDDDADGPRYAVETRSGTVVAGRGDWVTLNLGGGLGGGKVGVWPGDVFHGLYREDAADDCPPAAGTCPDCGGVGTVELPKHVRGGFAEVTCPRCGGKGRVT